MLSQKLETAFWFAGDFWYGITMPGILGVKVFGRLARKFNMHVKYIPNNQLLENNPISWGLPVFIFPLPKLLKFVAK